MKDAKAFMQEVVLEPLRDAGLITDHIACDLYGSVPDDFDFEQETFSCMLVVQDGQGKGNGLPVFVTTDSDAFRTHLRFCCSMLPAGWRKRLSFGHCVIDHTGLLLVVLSLDSDGFIQDSIGVHDGR